jgi:hypothetical protein
LLDAVARINGLEQRVANRCIAPLSCRNVDGYRVGFGSTEGVDFRRQSAAGATDGLLAFFLAAPAAC